MTEQGNIPIAEDLRYVYSEASVDPPRPARKWPLRARDNVIRHSIERISRAEAERDQFKADASWAATHRSELADLRDAFAKSEAEVAQLKAENLRLKAPVSDEEWEKHSRLNRGKGETVNGVYDVQPSWRDATRSDVTALLTARAQGGSNGV